MELWDVYDINRKFMGKTVLRSECHMLKEDEEFHLVVHIWHENTAGQYLIQKRSNSKDLLPGIWATTGGSAVSGEGSLLSAQRETEEEIGAYIEQDVFELLFSYVRGTSIVDVYKTLCSLDIETLVVDPNEVAAVKWATKEEIIGMVKTADFFDYGEHYFNQVFGC